MIPAKISEIKYCLQCQVMCSNLPHFVYKILQAQMQPLTIQIAFCIYLKMLYKLLSEYLHHLWKEAWKNFEFLLGICSFRLQGSWTRVIAFITLFSKEFYRQSLLGTPSFKRNIYQGAQLRNNIKFYNLID